MNKFTLAGIAATGLIVIAVGAVLTKFRRDDKNGEIKIDSGK